MTGSGRHHRLRGRFLAPKLAGDPPFVKHDDTIGQTETFRQFRGDEHDGHPLRSEAIDLLIDLLDFLTRRDAGIFMIEAGILRSPAESE